MRNKFFKIAFRVMSIIIVVAAIMVILNYSLFLFIARYSPLVKEPEITVASIAAELDSSRAKLSQNTAEMLHKSGLWVQLVSSEGQDVFNYNKPADVGDFYTLRDIAGLSRSYLKDYPVYVWESGENLVILGYPKNAVTRYNLSFPVNSIGSLPVSIILLILLNVVITVALSIFFTRQLIKPLAKIINGIKLLEEENEVRLHEKGVFEDLAHSINQTSGIIQEKNRKLKLRDTAVSNWLAGISHDVRTPLSMILGYSALMKEDDSLREEVRSQANIITQNALRLRELIENLNLASSLQYELLPLNLSCVKLSTIVRKAAAQCMNNGILGKCNLDMKLQNEMVLALVDESLFERALINLISNSAKHNRLGCNITIEIPEKVQGSFISIIVADDGKGIAPEKVERINCFNYFTTWVTQSLGLGLIIARSIVEAHKGQLIIEGEVGKGTKVIMKIPRAPEKRNTM